MAPSTRYSAVASVEDPDERDIDILEKERRSRLRSYVKWDLLGPVAWLFTTFLLAAVLILLVAAYTKRPTREECSAQRLEWSPAAEAIEYVDVQFQNKFDEHSIYRGKPNAEREKAWLDLWNFGPINIPYDKLDVLNKSADVTWQRTVPEDGGGIVGSLEVFHHIHCLDLIRQYTYRDEWDYSKTPAFDGTPKQIRAHVDHCINSLRVLLQCKVDTVVYMNVLDPNVRSGMHPDFNTRHQCVNFEKIHAWAKKHELDVRRYS